VLLSICFIPAAPTIKFGLRAAAERQENVLEDVDVDMAVAVLKGERRGKRTRAVRRRVVGVIAMSEGRKGKKGIVEDGNAN
jgi:hypothetical protein